VNEELKKSHEEAAGTYSRGKLNQYDEGALSIAVGHGKETVFFEFPKPTMWVAFPPDQAEELANLIKKHAQDVRILMEEKREAAR